MKITAKDIRKLQFHVRLLWTLNVATLIIIAGVAWVATNSNTSQLTDVVDPSSGPVAVEKKGEEFDAKDWLSHRERTSDGHLVIGRHNGIAAVKQNEGGLLFLDGNGKPDAIGVWRTPEQNIQYANGKKHGIEIHWANGFTRFSEYRDGLKHGREVVIKPTSGPYHNWTEQQFENGEAVGKPQFHYLEQSPAVPDI